MKIPNYNDCVNLCNLPDSPFYMLEYIVEGINIHMFNYRLAMYSDFLNPYAKEMRGICFTFNPDGTTNRFLLLNKFFNINETIESQYDLIKNYKLKYANNKEDGSIVSFIELHNGKVIARSKMGLTNDQCNNTNKIYHTNNDIRKFVDYCLNNDIIPIFEYCSPFNRIVVKYDKEELILIRLRCNKTGKYFDLEDFSEQIGNIKIAEKFMFNSLYDIIEYTKDLVEKEGFVITMEDDYNNTFFVKQKCDWYRNNHQLLTEDIYHENVIINMILEDNIDDLLSKLSEHKDVLENINKIAHVVRNEINERMQNIEKAYNDYLNLNISIKEYSLNHRKGNKYFHQVINLIKYNMAIKLTMEEIEEIGIEKHEKYLKINSTFEVVKRLIRNETKQLTMARKWLSEKDPTLCIRYIDISENN